MALNLRVEKCVHHVESYMIPYATIRMLRWHTLSAQTEAHTVLYVQSNY